MRRALLALAAFVCAGLALIAFSAGGGPQASGAGAPARAPAPATPAGVAASAGEQAAASVALARGRALFVSSCSACHGMGAGGISGRGPSLHGVGELAADFYLRTGRMPLPSPRAQPMRTRPAFAAAQIADLVAYVGSFGGPAIPTVQPAAGSLQRGHSLFALDCAGCHTIAAQGGIVTGAVVPSLQTASAREIAEAIRVGPYVMPRFGAGELSAGDVNSIARYVQSTDSPQDSGGWGIGRIGPIPEGMVAWLLAVAALLAIARLLGERTGDTPPPPPRGGQGTT
ncbi:MAG TPA: c-type cytochrome [Solirubrobacteraceae bacterium]|jgi:ubiquinol-cytochrome c reductase cytochrome c subunit